MSHLEWWHLVLGFLGTNGITFYLARPKRNSLEIDNFKKLFDEAQEERENIRKQYIEYEEKVNKRIKELEDKLSNMEQRSNKMIRAINTAYRCTLATDIRKCPVLEHWDDNTNGKEVGCSE